MDATTVKIDPKEEIGFMTVDETDFAAFFPEPADPPSRNGGATCSCRMCSDAEHIAVLKAELQDLPMGHKDYSEAQTFHPRTPVREPGGGRADRLSAGRGIPQSANGGRTSCSRTGLFYPHPLRLAGHLNAHRRPALWLVDLWLRRLFAAPFAGALLPRRPAARAGAPFRLIPRSHLSFHAQANPYVRYVSHPQGDYPLRQGWFGRHDTALLFHGTHPNKDLAPRELIQFGLPASLGGDRSSRWRSGIRRG